MNQSTRTPELDGLRGVAIGSVLLWHYVIDLSRPLEGSFLWWPHRLLSSTWSGVDLFFVLSGFLIGGILEDQRQAVNYFQVFYLRRAYRILPAYLLNLLVFVGFPLMFPALFAGTLFTWRPLPLWSYLTLVQNLLMAAAGELAGWAVTWSLAVEEQFYLLLPVVIRFARPWLVPILLAGVGLAPLFRHLAPNPIAAYVLPIGRCDSLFMGVLLALLMRYRPEWAHRIAGSRLLPSLALAGVALLVIYEPRWAEEPMRGLGMSAFAFAYAILLLCAQVGPHEGLRRALRQRPLCWLGQRAYFVYLAHGTALVALHGLILHAWPKLQTSADGVVTAVSLLATLAAAELSYRLIEEPAMRRGRATSWRHA